MHKAIISNVKTPRSETFTRTKVSKIRRLCYRKHNHRYLNQTPFARNVLPKLQNKLNFVNHKNMLTSKRYWKTLWQFSVSYKDQGSL